MTASPLPELPVLNETERSCLRRYLDLLVETLGEELVEVSVFGSVARDEAWPPGMPIRSDLDLLVVNEATVPPEVVDRLIDATLPLFLECGRQLGPQFRTVHQLAAPATERGRRFVEEVRRDAIRIYDR